jgi:N6-adenosine-specific RNA methylase IME4
MKKRSAKPAARRPAKSKASVHKTLKSAGKALKRSERVTSLAKVAHGPRPDDMRWPVEIKIGNRHRKDFGDLKSLAASIDDRGALLQPVVITTENVLIAGERRLKAWPLTRFKAEPIPVHVVTVDSIIAGEWDENARRKDFNPEEAVAIKKEIELQLAKLAKDRMRGGKKVDANGKGRAGDQAARAAGFDRRTIEKAEKIVAAAEKDPRTFGPLKDAMNHSGKVDGPYKRMVVLQQSASIRNEPSPLPMHGPYRTLVADVPWPGELDDENPAERGRAFFPYATMSIRQIVAMGPDIRRICHADGTWLWFWIPNFHLIKGAHLDILKAWDFEPCALRTWVKPHFGNGQLLRGQTEQVILCRRGKPPSINLTNQTTKLEGAASGEHSGKPASFFADVEALTPAPRYAYLFAGRQIPDKWDGHGDRVGKAKPAKARAAEADPFADANGMVKLDQTHVVAKEFVTEREKDDFLRRLMLALEAIAGGDVVSDADMCGELQKRKLIKGRKPKLTDDGVVRLESLREKFNGTPSPVRRTLPGRDAELIDFAEKNGHVVTMTIGAITKEGIGTCACGWSHREPRDTLAQDDPEGIKLRIARARAMDEAITAHWQEMRGVAQAPDDQLNIPGFLDRRPAVAQPEVSE